MPQRWDGVGEISFFDKYQQFDLYWTRLARCASVDIMTRLSIRIYLDAPTRALGPGMMQLLDGVARDGSIRKSAAAMKMSYRKAWLLIQTMQETFGGAVVTTTIGGSSGGGAQLTELGANLLRCYRRIEMRANRAAAADLQTLLDLTKSPKRPGRKT